MQLYKCDYKIMGVPERMANIVLLCSKLGLTYKDDVYIDMRHTHNPLQSQRYALEMPYSEVITHRVVIQDDAAVCDDFIEFTNYLANNYPNDIFALCNVKKKSLEIPKGSVCLQGGWSTGTCTLFPLKYVEGMHEMWKRENPYFFHSDAWVDYYAFKKGIRVLTTIPCSVKTHTSEEGFKSPMGHPGVAKCYVYEPRNIMRYEWKDRTDMAVMSKQKVFKLPIYPKNPKVIYDW